MAMNWIQRKIYLYNVTFGLYMLDWWERYLFNTLIVVLIWCILYNSSKYISDFCKRISNDIDRSNLFMDSHYSIVKALLRSSDLPLQHLYVREIKIDLF